MAPPTTLFPVSESAFLYGREAIAPATQAASYVTIPVPAYEPEDVPTWIHDVSLRGSQAETYDDIQGPVWSEHTFPTSPAYLDTFGHLLFNFFGDLTSTGTGAAPSTTLNGALAAGVTSVVVTSGTGFTANMWIQIDTGANAEIVQVLSVASNTLTLVATTPTRFSHLTAAAVTNTTAPYTSAFSTLNPASSTGVISGQPPTGTLVHRTQIPGTANHYAVAYPYAQLTELTITGTAMGTLNWSGKALSWPHAYPAVTLTPAPSTVRAQPGWRSVVGGPTIGTPGGGPASGGTQITNIAEWELAFTRSGDTYPAASGIQTPTIARGPVKGTLKLTYAPTIDEEPLLSMLNAVQPQLQFILTNGLAGANLVSFQLDAQAGQYERAKISSAKNLFGYDVTGELIANTTNAGNSGGYSPAKVTLQSAVQTY